MSQILSETTCSIAKIACQNADGAGATLSHRSTVFRWITKGIVIKGTRVRLEAERIGRKWITSEEAYERFRTACKEAAMGKPETYERTPAELKRDYKKAARGVDKLLKSK